MLFFLLRWPQPRGDGPAAVKALDRFAGCAKVRRRTQQWERWALPHRRSWVWPLCGFGVLRFQRTRNPFWGSECRGSACPRHCGSRLGTTETQFHRPGHHTICALRSRLADLRITWGLHVPRGAPGLPASPSPQLPRWSHTSNELALADCKCSAAASPRGSVPTSADRIRPSLRSVLRCRNATMEPFWVSLCWSCRRFGAVILGLGSQLELASSDVGSGCSLGVCLRRSADCKPQQTALALSQPKPCLLASKTLFIRSIPARNWWQPRCRTYPHPADLFHRRRQPTICSAVLAAWWCPLAFSHTRSNGRTTDRTALASSMTKSLWKSFQSQPMLSVLTSMSLFSQSLEARIK